MADKTGKPVTGWSDRELVSRRTSNIMLLTDIPQLVCLLNVIEVTGVKLEYNVRIDPQP
jgi:hypothetical protein